MGSGKSYLLGTLVESALVPIAGINSLPAPLAVVIFNYRRHSADRFELSSLAHPNPDRNDRERLERMYQASPRSVEDIHILCLPGQERSPPSRLALHGLHPSSVDDFRCSQRVPQVEAIRNALMDLQSARDVSGRTRTSTMFPPPDFESGYERFPNIPPVSWTWESPCSQQNLVGWRFPVVPRSSLLVVPRWF